MNDIKALKILGLPIKYTNLYYNDVRKAYLKASLKHHPDKSKDNGEKFKEVAHAYRYLMDNCRMKDIKEKQKTTTEENFDNILEEFIYKFFPELPQDVWSKIFIRTTIKTIIYKCENISFKILDSLDKYTCKQIYNFLLNIKKYDLGLINKEIINKMHKIVQDKFKNDNIILLQPSLEDLLNDKIYKLDISDNTYYIPLWHNEVLYDLKYNDENHDLIIKIEPELSKDIFIDHNNNLFIKKNVCLNEIFDNKGYKFILPNNKEIFIEAYKINLSNKTQMFKYDDIGILKLNEENLFQTDKRGSIIFELILENKKYNV